MAAKLACNSFLLYLLIVTITRGSEGVREMRSNNEDMKTEHVHAMTHSQPHSHMDHMDPTSMVYFVMHDLKLGNRLPFFFPHNDLSKSSHFIPRQEANSIPFSFEQLPYLLNFFSFEPSSTQAKAMKKTLEQCTVLKPTKGETRLCATSLESMLDFAQSILESPMKMMTTTTMHFTKPKTMIQNYTIIEEVKGGPVPKMVVCHPVPYPYKIFYCHSQEGGNRVFSVSFVGDDGTSIQAIAICHMDTSHWNPDNAAFQVLGTKPGSHVCHILPDDHLLFVPLPPAMSS